MDETDCMSQITEQDVLKALEKVRDPQSGKNLVANQMIKNIQLANGDVNFVVEFKDSGFVYKDAIVKSAENAITAIAGVSSVKAGISVKEDPLKVIQSKPSPPSQKQPPPPQQQGATQQPKQILKNVKYTIAVASGKGGVGKTTVSVNLAVSLAKAGYKVGLLDADIYGPNIPIMMGVNDKLATRNNRIAPLRKYDVDMVSVGFISQGDAAIIWRGPLVGRMIQQFLADVDWGDLDYLIIDMPPGTGDAQLTLTQTLSLTGAVVVCTPQEVALADVRKGVNMFKKVETPILGVIENMSYFIAPDTGKYYNIFGHGGGEKLAKNMEIPFLGEIPLEPATREGGDVGVPIVISNPDSPVSKSFETISGKISDYCKSKANSGLLKRVFKIN